VTASSRPLRVGLVGFGGRVAIARHIAGSGVPARIVAIVDPSPAARDRARTEYGPDVRIEESYADLLAEGALDAAVVTTPDWTHVPVAIDLLRAGVAVYLEKPMAIHLEEADELLRVGMETGTPLYIGHNYRHSSVVRLMARLIAAGEIGEVKTIWCRHFVGHGGDFYFKNWNSERAKVNTLLLQKASHDIDVIHMLAGGYSRRVTAMGALTLYGDVQSRRPVGDMRRPEEISLDNWPPLSQTALSAVIDVEDVAMVHMTLDNGVLAACEQCHYTPDYWRNYTVIGTEGRLENIGDTAGGTVKVWNRRREWSVAGDLEFPIGGDEVGHADADAITMAEFLRFAAWGEAPTLSPTAARAAVAAGALAAHSMRNGSIPVDIPPLPDDVLDYYATRVRRTDAA
jgi:predicted dehydrogenase